jgi:SWIM zinc finger
MKHNAAPTNPQHDMVAATDVLCKQAARKEREVTNEVVLMFKNKSLHSNLPTANTLTCLGNELVHNQWVEKDKYKISGPVANKWLCMREKESSNQRSMVPLFSRVRTVVYCPDKKHLLCSCQYFARVGIPCRHILKVLTEINGDAYRGVTADDVSIVWRKDYYYFGIEPSTDRERVKRREELLRQSDSDTKGPTVHIDVSSLPARLDPEIEIESQKTLVQRCRNYSEDDCRAAYNRASRYNVPANMTQETVDYSRTGRVSERIAFDANPVKEEIFQGDGGGDFSDAEEQDIGESVSGERDDEVQSVGMNDAMDFSIHNEDADQEAIDFGANDEASLSYAMTTMTLMPYEEYTPLFKQFVDFVQANRSNSRVLWGKSWWWTFVQPVIRTSGNV